MNGHALRLAHSGSLMSVMRWDLGLAIVDISSLTVPMLLGELGLPYHPTGLAMTDEYLRATIWVEPVSKLARPDRRDGEPRTISEGRSKTQRGLLEEHDLSLAAITPAFQPNNE
jgi:hypothetical protein